MSSELLGSHWQRKGGGRAKFVILKVWAEGETNPFRIPGIVVRCHPVRGGKVWFAQLHEIEKRFDRIETEGDDHE